MGRHHLQQLRAQARSGCRRDVPSLLGIQSQGQAGRCNSWRSPKPLDWDINADEIFIDMHDVVPETMLTKTLRTGDPTSTQVSGVFTDARAAGLVSDRGGVGWPNGRPARNRNRL